MQGTGRRFLQLAQGERCKRSGQSTKHKPSRNQSAVANRVTAQGFHRDNGLMHKMHSPALMETPDAISGPGTIRPKTGERKDWFHVDSSNSSRRVSVSRNGRMYNSLDINIGSVSHNIGNQTTLPSLPSRPAERCKLSLWAVMEILLALHSSLTARLESLLKAQAQWALRDELVTTAYSPIRR